MAHCLSYSLVALQEMNLAYHYPILFWNTANLIIDSGATFTFSEEEEDVEEEFEEDVIDTCEDGTCLVQEEKKKTVPSNYGKIASAIGRMQQRGISVLPPDINKSRRVFTPIPEDDSIRYGLMGMMRVGEGVVDDIIENRPYESVEDFLSKVKVTKPQMITLIKSGAFDSFDSRTNIMREYILSISDLKKTLNLRNVQMLIRYGLLPGNSGLDFQVRVFNFNKYIRKGYDKSGYLSLDETALHFYEQHFNMDILKVDEEGNTKINEKTWKAEYDDWMDDIRQYIKDNLKTLLKTLNNLLVEEMTLKYADGNLAKWSMDSVNFYQGEHELEGVDLSAWGVVDFWDLPEEPEVRNTFMSKQGYLVKMFHLHRIAGTVIDKAPLKSQITLLTTGGVITVQAYGVMQAYDKQISEMQASGKKKVVEKSWFTRGTKIIVNGMRRGEHTFIAKKYAKDRGHHFYKIVDIDEEGNALIQEERVEVA